MGHTCTRISYVHNITTTAVERVFNVSVRASHTVAVAHHFTPHARSRKTGLENCLSKCRDIANMYVARTYAHIINSLCVCAYDYVVLRSLCVFVHAFRPFDVFENPIPMRLCAQAINIIQFHISQYSRLRSTEHIQINKHKAVKHAWCCADVGFWVVVGPSATLWRSPRAWQINHRNPVYTNSPNHARVSYALLWAPTDTATNGQIRVEKNIHKIRYASVSLFLYGSHPLTSA